MRTILICLLTLLPAFAFAQDRCAHQAPRNLSLDLKGVKTVVFDIGRHDLTLRASNGAAAAVQGTACASDADKLLKLTVTQARSGNKLVVRAQQADYVNVSWSGNRYAYLKLSATLPDDIAVQLKVGSGDATVRGPASLSVDVNSGDVNVSNIRGAFIADVGSGDLKAENIGSLHLLSVGSGDVSIGKVRGALRIDEVNSGDLDITGTGGKVEIGSIGSGDVGLREIGGDVVLDSIGSGDLDVSGVRGSLTVKDVGSGSVSYRGVSGAVRLPAKD